MNISTLLAKIFHQINKSHHNVMGHWHASGPLDPKALTWTMWIIGVLFLAVLITAMTVVHTEAAPQIPSFEQYKENGAVVEIITSPFAKGLGFAHMWIFLAAGVYLICGAFHQYKGAFTQSLSSSDAPEGAMVKLSAHRFAIGESSEIFLCLLIYSLLFILSVLSSTIGILGTSSYSAHWSIEYIWAWTSAVKSFSFMTICVGILLLLAHFADRCKNRLKSRKDHLLFDTLPQEVQDKCIQVVQATGNRPSSDWLRWIAVKIYKRKH